MPKQNHIPILEREINTKNPLPARNAITLPSFYQIPAKRSNSKTKNQHPPKRTMILVAGMKPYDVLKNLDNIQPQITMKLLLAISPKCQSELNVSLIRKRIKPIEIYEISIDPGAPTVDVMIDKSLIPKVQIDNGSSVNLMTFEIMEELGLKTINSTPIILRMADQRRVLPMGLLAQIDTTIAGIDYKIDYIVFKLTESISSYPILLGRPWLYLAKVKDDWEKETLSI